MKLGLLALTGFVSVCSALTNIPKKESYKNEWAMNGQSPYVYFGNGVVAPSNSPTTLNWAGSISSLNNGWIMINDVPIYVIYYGPSNEWTASNQAYINWFINNMNSTHNSPHYYKVLKQYVVDGHLINGHAGNYTAGTPYVAQTTFIDPSWGWFGTLDSNGIWEISDTDIDNIVERVTGPNCSPACIPDNRYYNAVYLIMSGSNVLNINSGSGNSACSDYCGYHNVYSGSTSWKFLVYVQNPTYCWLPTQCGSIFNFQNTTNGQPIYDQMLNVVNHEIIEAITDGYGDALFDTTYGDEVMDKCTQVYVGIHGGNNTAYTATLSDGTISRKYLLDAVWDQSVGRCNMGV